MIVGFGNAHLRTWPMRFDGIRWAPKFRRFPNETLDIFRFSLKFSIFLPEISTFSLEIDKLPQQNHNVRSINRKNLPGKLCCSAHCGKKPLILFRDHWRRNFRPLTSVFGSTATIILHICQRKSTAQALTVQRTPELIVMDNDSTQKIKP